MFGNIIKRVQKHSKRREMINELSRLSDKDLNDIGISRCDIYSLAKSSF